MYAHIDVTTENRPNALVVPRNAVVDLDGKRGVFVAQDQVVAFRVIEVGIENAERVEIVSGATEQDRVVTTGAGALRDGDRILLARAGGQRGPGGAAGAGGAGGARGTGGPGGQAPANGAPPGGQGRPGGERRNSGA
jgi:multidrug efflux system membrane fusion protein